MSNLSEQDIYDSITKDFVVHDFDSFYKLIRERHKDFISDETANINFDDNSLLKGKYMLHKYTWDSLPDID